MFARDKVRCANCVIGVEFALLFRLVLLWCMADLVCNIMTFVLQIVYNAFIVVARPLLRLYVDVCHAFKSKVVGIRLLFLTSSAVATWPLT